MNRSTTTILRLPSVLVAWMALAVVAIPGLSQDAAAVDRLLYEAEQHERDGDLVAALRTYEVLVQQFPASPAASEALLRTARGRLTLGELAAAESAARTLVTAHSRSPQAAGGFVALGDIQEMTAASITDLEEAASTFRNAVVLFDRRAYPRLEGRSAGGTRSGEVSLRLGLDAAAASAFLDVIDHEPPSEWTVRSRLGFAAVLLGQGEWRAAAEILQAALDEESAAWSPDTLAPVRRRLGFIQRLWVRPETGQPRWQSARLLQPGGLKRPMGLAVQEDGRLLIADAGEGQVILVEADGQTGNRWALQGADRPTWGADGSVWATTSQTLRAVSAGESLLFGSLPGKKDKPLEGLAAAEPGRFGTWLVLSRKPPQALVFGPDREYMKAMTAAKEGVPADLARDRQERIYVLDAKGRQVERFTAAGAADGRVASGDWKAAAGLALDPAGHLYVVDEGSRQVEIFDAAGRRLATVGPALPGGLELKRPLDVAVDGAGRLFIADAKLSAVVMLE